MPFVLLFYRHFGKFVPGCSHVGLGNNALFTARVLKGHGVDVRPVGVNTPDHIRAALAQAPQTTHAVIEGTWLTPTDVEQLAAEHDRIEWSCREHSQITFLMVQRKGIEYTRGYGYLLDRSLNFAMSANNERFCRYWIKAYNQHCLHLPNLYPLDANPAPRRRRAEQRDVLRISSFGAGRVFKNHPTSAAAALMIGRELGRDVELHINVGREPNLEQAPEACRQIFAGVPGCKVVEHRWQSWGEFRHWCGAMDLGLAPTFSETFCLTAADHIAAGVPVVGTEAVEWLPRYWMASSDDPGDVARIGIGLILNPHAAEDGQTSLAAYNARSVGQWLDWLKVSSA